jgi:hypothetical protein
MNQGIKNIRFVIVIRRHQGTRKLAQPIPLVLETMRPRFHFLSIFFSDIPISKNNVHWYQRTIAAKIHHRTPRSFTSSSVQLTFPRRQAHSHV